MVDQTEDQAQMADPQVALDDPFHRINADFIHADAAEGRTLDPREIMVVPGSDVAVLTLDLPDGIRGQNRERVARRQLSDTLGLDPDTIDMRPMRTRGTSDQWPRVLVTDRALVEHWRNRAGVTCRAVLPDFLVLPTAPDLWTVAVTPEGVAVRLGPDDGFGAAHASAPALLHQALRDADPAPRALLRIGEPLPDLEALAAAQDVPVLTDASQTEPLGLALPQALAHGEVQMDLRQDPRLARARLARRVLPWRWPVVLGLAATMMWSASQIVTIDRIDNEVRDIRRNTDAMVRAHFVATGPILDPRIQVTQALTRLQSQVAAPDDRVDPMRLFNRAAGVVAQVGAETRSAVFAGGDGLSLVLLVADFAAAEGLIQALADAGLEVAVTDTRASDGASTVRVELTVAPAAQASP